MLNDASPVLNPPARVIVAGGGSAEDQWPIDQQFASWLDPHDSILYLPIAMQDQQAQDAYADSWEWIHQTLAPFGRTNIHMWTSLAGKTAHDLAQFDAVYIGGGNTYWLLHQLRVHRLEAALGNFIRRGRPVYGGSAGAILLGRDIQTCAHLDDNAVGLIDTHGLDMLCGYAIWCHYQPGDVQRIAAFMAAQAMPVLALSERAGVCRDGSRLTAVGYEAVTCFTGAGQTVFGVGELISAI